MATQCKIIIFLLYFSMVETASSISLRLLKPVDNTIVLSFFAIYSKKGILLTSGLVIFKGKGKQEYQIFQKKKFKDYVPNTKISKKNIEKQVIFDTKTQSIFDYDIYVSEKRLEDLGELGKEGKVI